MPFLPVISPQANSRLQIHFFYQTSNKLRRLLQFFRYNDYAFSLLQLLLQDASYASLARQCFISETAAKYRVKKMQKLCGVNTREELVRYISKIF